MTRTGSSLRFVLPLLSAFAMMTASANAQTAGLGIAGELVDPDVLRVCADPSNLPFSDENGQGFENKLADLVAENTGRKSVTYTWFPSVMGFVRNTLGLNRCDIIMGFAQGDELVQNTNAYYRSAYVLVYPKGKGLDGIDTLSDERLQGKRLGVVETTPPTALMAANKLLKTAKIYPLTIDTRVTESMAERSIRDMNNGEIDAAVLWGPMAGYYARESKADLAVVPLLKETSGQRMIYRITMGVRTSDQEWKRILNRFIRDKQPEINSLLLSYGVPLIDEHDKQITQ